jgi:tRNA threonylcarbamoyl adenosine modification protein (Sua5/YciO/YrdC/YwlC family)
MTRSFTTVDVVERERGLTMAASVARRGGLIVLPVETSYALATDAFSQPGIERLRAAKGRGGSGPVPVLIPGLRTADGLCRVVSETMRELARAFWPGPLTVVAPASQALGGALGTHGTVMLRVPLHPVALELLARTGPLVATAANSPGAAPPSTVAEALGQLGGRVEVALDAGARPTGAASDIVDVTGPVPRLVRSGAFGAERIRAVLPDLEIAE